GDELAEVLGQALEVDGGHYRLIAPKVRPRTRYRWIARPRIAGGRIRMMPSAACGPYSCPAPADWSPFRKTGAVIVLSPEMTRASRTSDRWGRTTKRIGAASPPLPFGSAAVKKAPHWVQPSTTAASPISRGSSWKKLRISQTTKGKVTAAYTSQSPQNVFTSDR